MCHEELGLPAVVIYPKTKSTPVDIFPKHFVVPCVSRENCASEDTSQVTMITKPFKVTRLYHFSVFVHYLLLIDSLSLLYLTVL